ncbi:precorrin-2 C(20)-methyltransferase [Salininema proteolyticum]|uniref:Precorrin-2 C(20)-methyltransferase n=1 Tax=Salininema proteolyticum TaxID=1607685 RepID=A0ABV8U4L5_9ACTN
MTGTLTGVGLGPGDPKLVTMAGVEALQNADTVYAPVSVTTEGEGFAEKILSAYVAPERVVRLPFALRGPEREESWRDAARVVAEPLRDGGRLAFATIGDPNTYSTFTYLAREVADLVPGAAVDTVPGVTAASLLASRAGTVLCEHDEPLTIVPATAGEDVLDRALAGEGTVVIYKGGRHFDRLAEKIEATGRVREIAFGTRLGTEGESVSKSLPQGREHYLSTVIVRLKENGAHG